MGKSVNFRLSLPAVGIRVLLLCALQVVFSVANAEDLYLRVTSRDEYIPSNQLKIFANGKLEQPEANPVISGFHRYKLFPGQYRLSITDTRLGTKDLAFSILPDLDYVIDIDLDVFSALSSGSSGDKPKWDDQPLWLESSSGVKTSVSQLQQYEHEDIYLVSAGSRRILVRQLYGTDQVQKNELHMLLSLMLDVPYDLTNWHLGYKLRRQIPFSGLSESDYQSLTPEIPKMVQSCDSLYVFLRLRDQGRELKPGEYTLTTRDGQEISSDLINNISIIPMTSGGDIYIKRDRKKRIMIKTNGTMHCWLDLDLAKLDQKDVVPEVQSVVIDLRMSQAQEAPMNLFYGSYQLKDSQQGFTIVNPTITGHSGAWVLMVNTLNNIMIYSDQLSEGIRDLFVGLHLIYAELDDRLIIDAAELCAVGQIVAAQDPKPSSGGDNSKIGFMEVVDMKQAKVDISKYKGDYNDSVLNFIAKESPTRIDYLPHGMYPWLIWKNQEK